MTVLTTVCYLKKNHQTLMLYRNKKENDINMGKWIGIGGKLENGESPDECIQREFFEETGLILDHFELKAYITFPKILHGEDEGMFLYVASEYHGEMKSDCAEGELRWINDDSLKNLAMWEGDRYFDKWLKQPGFTVAKLIYENDKLVKKISKHYQ